MNSTYTVLLKDGGLYADVSLIVDSSSRLVLVQSPGRPPREIPFQEVATILDADGREVTDAILDGRSASGLRSGAIEAGLAGAITSVQGSTRSTLALRVGSFLGAFSGLAGFEAEVGYHHQRWLNIMTLEGAVSWQRRVGNPALYPFAALGGGVRQARPGSFRQPDHLMGFALGLRALLGARAGLRVEYRYRRVPGDRVSEHQALTGVSLLFRNGTREELGGGGIIAATGGLPGAGPASTTPPPMQGGIAATPTSTSAATATPAPSPSESLPPIPYTVVAGAEKSGACPSPDVVTGTWTIVQDGPSYAGQDAVIEVTGDVTKTLHVPVAADGRMTVRIPLTGCPKTWTVSHKLVSIGGRPVVPARAQASEGPGASASAVPSPEKGDAQKEWLKASKSDSVESYLEFLKTFRDTQYAPDAVKRIFARATSDKRLTGDLLIPFDLGQGKDATFILWVIEASSMVIYGTPETSLYIIRDSSSPLIFDQQDKGLSYKSGKGIAIRVRGDEIKTIWGFELGR